DAQTFPRFSKRLALHAVHDPVLMVMAVAQGQPLGAVVAEHAPDAVKGRLLSCWVRPDRRRQGLGTALLLRLEALLAERGCTTLEAPYRSNWASTAAFEGLMQSLGWAPPRCAQVLCVNHDLPRLLQTRWLQRAALPDGVEVFPWADLTAAEAEVITRTQDAEAWFDSVLTPFQLEHLLEPTTSFGLRQSGQVIGWIVRHRLRPDRLQCTTFAVRRGAPYGCGLALLRHSIAAQVDLGIRDASYMVDANNRKMLAFMRRRLAPYGMTEAENRIGQKKLAPVS
ncbi:MAG: GNAT family N-acetyltransferase, partial [Bacteroidota bacterium]